jgi:hypothetical protein
MLGVFFSSPTPDTPADLVARNAALPNNAAPATPNPINSADAIILLFVINDDER